MLGYAKNKVSPLLVVAIIALLIIIAAGVDNSLPSYESVFGAKTAASADDISSTYSGTSESQTDNPVKAGKIEETPVETNPTTNGKVYGMTTGALVMPILDSRILSANFIDTDRYGVRGVASVNLNAGGYRIGMFPDSEMYSNRDMGLLIARPNGEGNFDLSTELIKRISRNEPEIKMGLYIIE